MLRDLFRTAVFGKLPWNFEEICVRKYEKSISEPFMYLTWSTTEHWQTIRRTSNTNQIKPVRNRTVRKSRCNSFLEQQTIRERERFNTPWFG